MSHIFMIDQTMAAPPERVMDALIAIDQWVEWRPGLIKIEKLSNNAFGPGFRWRETRRQSGRNSIEEFAVEACEPPHSLVLTRDGKKGTTGQGVYRYRYDLIPKGGLTQVSLLCEIDEVGRWRDRFFWIFGGKFKNQAAREVAALRRFVERIRPL